MGGGSGGIIVRSRARETLTDPVVSGSLPDRLKLAISPILQKDDADWSVQDDMVIAHVFSWALCHLP